MLENIKGKTALILNAEVRRVAASAVAIMLGSFIFLSTGFAPMASVHYATHDTRHAFSMPCH